MANMLQVQMPRLFLGGDERLSAGLLGGGPAEQSKGNWRKHSQPGFPQESALEQSKGNWRKHSQPHIFSRKTGPKGSCDLPRKSCDLSRMVATCMYLNVS